jgi:hypothetical protein
MEGVKYTVMVQFVPAATDDPHPLEYEKSALLAPSRSNPLMATVVLPSFVTVTVELVWVPSVTSPKLIDVGDSLIDVPVPDNAAVCGLVTSLSVTLRVPAPQGFEPRYADSESLLRSLRICWALHSVSSFLEF